jgi:hypothetical protein
MAMKKLFLLPALLVALVGCDKKDKEVSIPAPVKEAFAAQHPNAKDVDWEEEDGNYEADFKTNDVKQTVVISPAGKIIETETEIKPTELPVPVQATLESKYHGLKVKEAEKIVMENETRYEAEIDSAGQELEVHLSADGMIIKVKTEDKENDDKD